MKDKNEFLPYVKLRFGVKHPDLEDCYIEGYEAAQSAKEESDNPFRYGSKEYDMWTDGWWDGFYNEAPIFKRHVIKGIRKQPAANETAYFSIKQRIFSKVVEWSAVIAATAAVGYQVVDLVA